MWFKKLGAAPLFASPEAVAKFFFDKAYGLGWANFPFGGPSGKSSRGQPDLSIVCKSEG